MRAEVEAFCARIGVDRLLVQGCGGNVSWKDRNGCLWVKASGTSLADALHRPIFVPVAIAPARSAIHAGADITASVSGDGLRPSIETLLHVLLPQRIVVHLHAVDILATLVRRDGTAEQERLLRGFGWQYASVPYAKPGSGLAARVMQATTAQPLAQLLLLENHGVVLAADHLGEIDAMLADITRRFSPQALYRPPSVVRPVASVAVGGGTVLEPLQDDVGDFHGLACDPQWLRRLREDWALYPDHLVFLGRQAAIHSSMSEAMAACRDGQVPAGLPQFIAGLGCFAVSGLSPARLAQLRCYQDVLERQYANAVLVSLPADEIDELLDWEAERYRQAISGAC